MITKENILFSTFIGLHVEIANSSQRSYIGLEGTVVDETKNLIVIELEPKGDMVSSDTIPNTTQKADSNEAEGPEESKESKEPKEPEQSKELKIPKASSVFRFTLDDGTKMDVDGRDISFRPHERAKKV